MYVEPPLVVGAAEKGQRILQEAHLQISAACQQARIGCGPWRGSPLSSSRNGYGGVVLSFEAIMVLLRLEKMGSNMSTW